MEKLKVGDSVVIRNSYMPEKVFVTRVKKKWFSKTEYSIAYRLDTGKLNLLDGFYRESLVKR